MGYELNGRVIEMKRVSKTLILCLILAICLGVTFNEYLRLSRNVSRVLWQNYLDLSYNIECVRDIENVETMTDEEYAAVMKSVYKANLSYVSLNNQFTGNSRSYKKLALSEFEWFLLELSYGEKKETRDEYQVLLEIADIIGPLWKEPQTVNYNFTKDPSDIKGKIAEIERICEEYLTSIGK